MKRTINVDQANWLAQTIERNRAMYGGLKMMTDEPPKGDPPAGDAPLGEAGIKALEAEREARKAAQQDLTNLRTEFDGVKTTLAEAFGIKPDASKGGDDVLAAVQKGLEEIKHEAAVLRLANEHKITDKDDLELLSSARDAGAMEKLAARLAAKADAGADPEAEKKQERKPGPRPDLSQGGKERQPAPESLPGVPRMAAAFEDAMNAKTH